MHNVPDEILIALQHRLASHAPAGVRPVLSALLAVIAILVAFATLFALTTILERKGLARMQNRYGPNRVGFFGSLQPLADGIKSLTKEDIVPDSADKVMHLLAPVVLVIAAFSLYAVLPIGRNMVLANLDAGVLFFFAVSSVMELAIFMAGWSSRNKYSLLGAMRAIAQMISYEVPLVLSSLTVVMAAGSLSTVTIVESQAGYTSIFPHWYIFTPWGAMGFLLFLIAAAAESNRSPFDLPEGESEIIAGYYTEYSGFKFALFFLGEYLGLFAISGLGITLFLGGWSAPLSFLVGIPTFVWFFAKLLGLIVLFIWVRGTLPRLRMDQLMAFAWKFLLPMASINLVAAGLWHFLPSGPVRWIVSSAVVLIPYILLARGLQPRRPERRTYRFAE